MTKKTILILSTFTIFLGLIFGYSNWQNSSIESNAKTTINQSLEQKEINKKYGKLTNKQEIKNIELESKTCNDDNCTYIFIIDGKKVQGFSDKSSQVITFK